jgi:hypothetical protein
MANKVVSPHEAIELSEFLGQEMLGIKKINASLQMVKDEDLKSFLQDSLNSKKYALNEIKSALGPQMGL